MLFSEIIGQQELKQRLILSVKNDRISHAQIWLGNPGYGGLPMALAYCQYIFCEQPGEKDSCGSCASCQKVQKLQHPDLHFAFPVVSAESKISDKFYPEWREQLLSQSYFDLNQWVFKLNDKGKNPLIGSEESLNILKKLRLKSYEGGYKVMLIWMAEEMNDTCASKLLKILEEPPEKTLFLLLVENSDRILSTILSRTQLLKLRPIDHASLVDELIHKFDMNLSEADSLAHISEGNWLTAQELAAFGSRNVVVRENFIDGFRAAYKKDVVAMMKWATNIAELSAQEQKAFLKYGLHLFRQSLLFNYTDDQLIKLNKEEHDFIKNFSRFVSGNNFEDLYRLFSDSHYHIERNANNILLFTDLIFQVMRLIHTA